MMTVRVRGEYHPQWKKLVYFDTIRPDGQWRTTMATLEGQSPQRALEMLARDSRGGRCEDLLRSELPTEKRRYAERD